MRENVRVALEALSSQEPNPEASQLAERLFEVYVKHGVLQLVRRLLDEILSSDPALTPSDQILKARLKVAALAVLEQVTGKELEEALQSRAEDAEYGLSFSVLSAPPSLPKVEEFYNEYIKNTDVGALPAVFLVVKAISVLLRLVGTQLDEPQFEKFTEWVPQNPVTLIKSQVIV